MAVHKKNKTLEPKERFRRERIEAGSADQTIYICSKESEGEKASSSDRKKAPPAWNPEKRRLKSA